MSANTLQILQYLRNICFVEDVLGAYYDPIRDCESARNYNSARIDIDESESESDDSNNDDENNRVGLSEAIDESNYYFLGQYQFVQLNCSNKLIKKIEFQTVH